MANLNLYLTSLEPDMSQMNYSQSLGGYCSNSLIYPQTTLSETLGLYDTSFVLDTPDSGSWSEWMGVEYINIGNEIMQISPLVNGDISVVQRGYNGIINMHINGDTVRAVSTKKLFNDVFNDSHKQYRCIAIKNDSLETDPSSDIVAYDISIYLKQKSLNPNCHIRVALEQPNSQYITSNSTSWTSMQIVDSSLIGLYPDNHFKEAYLKVLSGEASGSGKIVRSFDSSTGTFIFYNSFSSDYDYSSNVEYEVLPSPAQRVSTGTISPDTSLENILSFFSPVESNPIRISSGSWSVPVFPDLYRKNIMYLWIEREVEKGSENFDANSIIINVKYSTG